MKKCQSGGLWNTFLWRESSCHSDNFSSLWWQLGLKLWEPQCLFLYLPQFHYSLPHSGGNKEEKRPSLQNVHGQRVELAMREKILSYCLLLERMDAAVTSFFCRIVTYVPALSPPFRPFSFGRWEWSGGINISCLSETGNEPPLNSPSARW